MTPPSLEDRAAAEEALALATTRLERTAAALEKWKGQPGAVRSRMVGSHERAWSEYLLALVVCLAICPRRLSKGQRMLARLAREERERPPRGAAP